MAPAPKPTTIILVRHGTTPSTGAILPGRAKGLHLSDRGQAQAQAAAERIAELTTKPVAIYASPLERTRETAAPIAKALGLKTHSARGLLECDFGKWTGAKLDKLRKLPEWQSVQHSPSTFRFPEGESFLEMQMRMHQAVTTIATRHPGKTVVCVSHADPIKAVLASFLGTPLDLFQRITVSPCSQSVVVLGHGSPHVLSVNSTSSLTELVIQ
jgi:probable phosphomutase (TIGR03848 family)